MKILCINKADGLTIGKEYDVIRICPKPNSRFITGGYILINDNNEEKWYEESPMGIIEVILLTDTFLEYIGPESNGLTFGKTYQILDKQSSEYYYLMSDNNRFVGISKRNYLGGKPNFRNRIKERNDKINNLWKKLKVN